MNIKDKKIGIWGYGIVGKSLINFFKNKTTLSLMDNQYLSKKVLRSLQKENIKFYNQDNYASFFKNNDFIIPSPGINLLPYTQYQDKFISELDLFFEYFSKKIIAITGTLGKTSITHLLTQILINQNIKAIEAGNIGNALINTIEKQNNLDLAVLELSSFQLEYCKKFAPDLAIWTNFYPNHLDRHENIEKYFEAKKKILINQTKKQKVLLPIELIDKINDCKSQINYFSINKQKKLFLRNNDSYFFYIENNNIMAYKNGYIKKIISIKKLNKTNTFLTNWIIIYASLFLLNLPIKPTNKKFKIPPHRLEKVITHNDIDFYNDSKSTVPESTLSAIEKLNNKPIVLILGGLSKGIDKSFFIKNLKNKIKKIYCFGKEADYLYNLCKINNLCCKKFINLEDLLEDCFQNTKKGEQVLFSPAGSSFDMFKNYKERGKSFKTLIKKIIKDKKSVYTKRTNKI